MARIVFLQKPVEEWLGVMYLSSMLKSHGHQTDIFVEPLEKGAILKKALSKSPDIIAFSCLTTDYHWAIERAREIKDRSDCLVVMGGTHITLSPYEAISNPHVDIICIGEGEKPLTELADSVDKNLDYTNIKNLWIKVRGRIIKNDIRNLISDLDSLPFPDRELYTKYPIFKNRGKRPIHLGRGCPYSCTCCHNARKKELYRNKGRYVRWRSKENVLAEINDIRKNYFVKVVHFVDDSFGVNREWLMDFITSLSRNGKDKIAIQANMRADMVTEGLCGVFEKYGVNHLRLRIAVECGDEYFRRNILRKDISNERLINAGDMLHRYNIQFVTYNMVCLPGETLAQAFETLRMNLRLKPLLALCFVFQPFPGTELAEYSINKGYLSPQSFAELGSKEYGGYYYSKSPLRQKEIRELENLHKLFGIVVNNPMLLPLAKIAVKSQLIRPILAIAYKAHIRGVLFKRYLKDRH